MRQALLVAPTPAFVESIATPRGSVFANVILPNSLDQTNIIKTNGHMQSIHMVVSGRAQAALMAPRLFHYLQEHGRHTTRQLVPL